MAAEPVSEDSPGDGRPPPAGSAGDAAPAEARLALLAKYVSSKELAQLRECMRAHLHEWPALYAQVRQAIDGGVRPEDEAGAQLARRWQALLRDTFSGADRRLELKVRSAFAQEPALSAAPGRDVEAVAFVHRAAEIIAAAGLHPGADAGPKPSALAVARMRAAHQILDAPPVFPDPLALAILGPQEEAQLRAGLQAHEDPVAQSVRATLVARSRIALDGWNEAAGRGVAQYVILGAGLDTSAYRAPPTAAARVFEVDHPDTQRWKRRRLREAGVAEPPWLSFVSTDFEDGGLEAALAASGFRREAPAFFSWLGVVVYLEREAIARTLRFIGSCAAGSAVVFDFVVDPALLDDRERIGVQVASARVARHGEPWKTFFDPAQLERELRDAGFSSVAVLEAAQINERLFAGRADTLRMGRTSRIVHAVV
jgi:methyltransferase (TIGR00027 family)